MSKRIALIGYGYLGQAYHKLFPDAVIYDEPKHMLSYENGVGRRIELPKDESEEEWLHYARQKVNECDMAIVAVPTELQDGKLDMSIINSIVGWVKTPLILLKSALQPGTVDRLVKETGKKIAVSVEFIGQGSYYQSPHKYPDPKDPSKHDMLIVGGELETATACAEIIWSKMSPDVKVHLLTAKEAEMCKLIENAWGAMKVTWANCMYSVIEKGGGNPLKTHQAWKSDGRVEGMHTRVLSYKRGWKSHCFDKDIPALAEFAKSIGADDMQILLGTVLMLNREHNALNE